MGRKKKRGRQQDIWCYFCDKTFKDEDLLLSHQLKTHFRCTICGKRATNVGGLAAHMMQVHKSVLGKVPDSIKGRDNPKVGHSINGMSYIPHEALQERALNTGVNLSNNNNNNNHSNNNNSHGSKRPKYNPMQHANQMNGAMGLMGGMQPQYGYQASYGGGYYQPRGQPVQNFYSMPPQYPPTQMYQQAVVPPPLPGMNIGMNMMQGAPPGMVLPPGMPPPLLGGGFMQTLPPSQPYINNMQYQPPPQGMNSVQKLPTSDNNNVANNNKNNIGETKPSSISPIPPVLNTISSSSNNLPPPGLLTQGLPPGLTPPTLPPFAPPPNNNNFIQNNTSINSTVSPNIIVHQNDNINTTTANNSNKNSPVPPSTSSTTISTSNVVEITTKATKKKKKKSNVHILFKSENNMSMEEMRALAWKKNKLLSKLQ